MSEWNETHRETLEQNLSSFERMTQRAPAIEKRMVALRAVLAEIERLRAEKHLLLNRLAELEPAASTRVSIREALERGEA